MIYLFFLFIVALGYVTRPLFLNLLKEGNLIQPNYRDDEVPVGMGLYLFFNLITAWAIGYLINLYSFYNVINLMLLTGFFAFLGFIDDILGNNKARGLIGHFRCLVYGRLTTGGLKALGAASVALVIAINLSENMIQVIIKWLILLLSTNFINLLDLRPGRAVKFFSISIILIFLFSPVKLLSLWYLALPLLSALFFYTPLDLRALVMLGDTGANLLGGILGFFIISVVSFWGQVIILFTLILIHLYSERYSLSVLIEENRVLNWVDRLGRT